MKVQRIGYAKALKESEIALNKAIGMRSMSPDLTKRAIAAAKDIRRLRAFYDA